MSEPTKEDFLVDNILKPEHICNLEEDTQKIVSLLSQGEHIVFYGRRNMGKTSLILGKVIPEIKKKYKQALCVFTDFLGVQSEEEIAERFKHSLQKALVETYPTQIKLKSMLQNLFKFNLT